MVLDTVDISLFYIITYKFVVFFLQGISMCECSTDLFPPNCLGIKMLFTYLGHCFVSSLKELNNVYVTKEIPSHFYGI